MQEIKMYKLHSHLPMLRKKKENLRGLIFYSVIWLIIIFFISKSISAM